MSLMDDTSLAVALGANQPSVAGSPRDTLLAVRPLLEQHVADWARSAPVCCWSELFDTDPVGPQDQPSYLNAVLLVRAVPAAPSSAAALNCCVVCSIWKLVLVGIDRVSSAGDHAAWIWICSFGVS